MRARMRGGLLALGLALAAAGCGDSGDDGLQLPSRPADTPTTITAAPPDLPAPPAPVTTAPARATGGRSCADILSDGIDLARSYSRDVRGIAGADEAQYRADAQALVDEARGLGCPIPGAVEEFLR